MRVSNIYGMYVLTSDGEKIGEVLDIQVDTDSWKLTKLILKPSDKIAKEFGLKKRFRGSKPIEMEVNVIKSIQDVIMLSLDSKEFRKMLKRQFLGETS
ncbi:MAG: hypothetical protein DRN90_06910 [Thermoproteota archaeon]|nr:MAG: hypothetical protein DRN90_06910 [Candidatus Korarchaeota archaeon]RLG47787.1 MAG: hypothetical protein DRN92_02445 [Candidatus Korarchaeota archaeon]